MRYGLAFEGFATNYLYFNPYGLDITQDQNTFSLSGYITYKIATGKWLIDPGVRYIYYNAFNAGSFEPRISAKFNATDVLRFKMASGIIIHASGQVRIDTMTPEGILNSDTMTLTHRLHSLRRITT